MTLTPEERINRKNFPDLMGYRDQVVAIFDLVDAVVKEVEEIEMGERTVSTFLASELARRKDEIRALIVEMGAMKPVPYPLIYVLRELSIGLGLLATRPDLFRGE